MLEHMHSCQGSSLTLENQHVSLPDINLSDLLLFFSLDNLSVKDATRLTYLHCQANGFLTLGRKKIVVPFHPLFVPLPSILELLQSWFCIHSLLYFLF